MKTFIPTLFLAWLVPGFAGPLRGAEPARTNRPPSLPPILSPEVHPDRTVTFRVRAPAAREVMVSGEWGGGNLALTKGDDGVWTGKTGALASDLYGYSVLVDGFRSLDPANPAVKPMRSPTTSILDVPGERPSLHDFQAVPHGTVSQHHYESKAAGKRRSIFVYTPPNYDSSRRAKYPVLYLFHGSGDNEATWTVLGRAHWITDNLIAQRKVRPLVIVMTDGHAAPPAPPGGGGDGRNRNLQVFERDLLDEVIPLVESRYRVRADAQGRAIIGLSMGGGQSLSIGLNHPDRFAWVGGMSSAVSNPESTIASALADPQATNKQLKLLWFACGKADFLLKPNQELSQLLKAKGVRHEYLETEGNHSWPVWRRYLVDFLPRLFPED